MKAWREQECSPFGKLPAPCKRSVLSPGKATWKRNRHPGQQPQLTASGLSLHEPLETTLGTCSTEQWHDQVYLFTHTHTDPTRVPLGGNAKDGLDKHSGIRKTSVQDMPKSSQR